MGYASHDNSNSIFAIIQTISLVETRCLEKEVIFRIQNSVEAATGGVL